MMDAQRSRPPTLATVGFAAHPAGRGVAYAALRYAGDQDSSLVRVEFQCRPSEALGGRDVGYAALSAVAGDLQHRGISQVQFTIDDERLALDIQERRVLPKALVMPYVSLRCRLNCFRLATVAAAPRCARDLTARARAETSLTVAA